MYIADKGVYMFFDLKDNMRDLSALLTIMSYWVRHRIDACAKNNSGSPD